MPSESEILAQLARIANDASAVAIAWHVVVAAAVLALLFASWPSRSVGAALAVLPLASVSLVAFAYASPFNGVLFALLVIALLAIAVRLDRRLQVELGPPWAAAVGGASIAFAWVYPHFLEPARAHGGLAYLYAAPMGLLPCPTLLLAIGLALMGNAYGSRAYGVVLAGAGLFYGVFGASRLGVSLDVSLIFAALALAIASLAPAGALGRRPRPT